MCNFGREPSPGVGLASLIFSQSAGPEPVLVVEFLRGYLLDFYSLKPSLDLVLPCLPGRSQVKVFVYEIQKIRLRKVSDFDGTIRTPIYEEIMNVDDENDKNVLIRSNFNILLREMEI